jgi:hypothetical protein
MRRIFARAVIALGLAAVGLVAASAATAHADTGDINITFGPMSYSCSPCTSTSANTTTTYTTGGVTQTFSTRAPNTGQLYLKNTTTDASGTTSTNWYGGNLGLWGGRSTTTQSGTSGYQGGYYTNTGTIKYTNWP